MNKTIKQSTIDAAPVCAEGKVWISKLVLELGYTIEGKKSVVLHEKIGAVWVTTAHAYLVIRGTSGRYNLVRLHGVDAGTTVWSGNDGVHTLSALLIDNNFHYRKSYKSLEEYCNAQIANE